MSGPLRISLLRGDPAAIAAIRSETRDAYGATDIAENAPVFLSYGLIVRGADGREYEVPEEIQQRYLEERPFPEAPVARFGAESSQPASFSSDPGPIPSDLPSNIPGEVWDINNPMEEPNLKGGVPVQGDPEAIEFIRNATRLYHEVSGVIFPVNSELRWFKTGIHVVDVGSKMAFQAPMDRIADLICPREFPLLPVVRMSATARKAMRA